MTPNPSLTFPEDVCGLTPAESIRAAEELFESGQPIEARERLERLLHVPLGDEQLRAEVLCDLAVIAVVEGDLERASELALQAIDARPGHPAAIDVIAHCASVRQQQSAALSEELQRARVAQYRTLSTCARVRGEPILEQPVLLSGQGQIVFGRSVQFGWRQSPGFHDRYGYVEAAHEHTRIEIGDNSFFNNGATLRAEGPGISIGAECLFGWFVQVLDSDFHDLHPARRRSGNPGTAHVSIGDNVFVGASTIVMKGVTIGDNTVIGAGSVVVHSLPSGVIAAGTPARVIRPLEDEPTAAES